MATPGLVFRIGGVLDPSYRGALAQSVAEAKVVQAQIQRAMRVEARQVGRALDKANPRSAEASALFIQQQSLLRRQNILFANSAKQRIALSEAEAAELIALNREKIDAIMLQERMAGAAYESEKQAELAALDMLQNEEIALSAKTAAEIAAINKAAWLKGQGEWRAIQAAQTAEMLANFEKQRIAAAALKADQLAMLTTIATGGGASAKSSGGGHGAGGLTGIIRESLVIIREVSMGRGLGRIGGSVTLLAQYLGILKYAVKSTATESLLASAAESKLAQSMARQALMARGTAEYTALAAAATQQEAKAAAAATEANIALASATVKLNWVFWGWIGFVVAAAAALFYLVEGMRAAKKSAQDLADHLSKTHDEFADGVEALEAHHKAMLDDAKAAAELNDWLEKLANTTATTTDAMNDQLDTMRERFELQKEIARQNGATDAQIRVMEQAERESELAIVNAALDKAKKDAADAKAAGIKASTDAEAHRKLIDENKEKKDFDKTIEAVEYLNSRIPDSVKTDIAKRQAEIDAVHAAQKAGNANPAAVAVLPEAQRQLDEIRNTEYGKQSLLGIGDGKAIVSPNEVQGIYQQALSARALFLGQQEKLQSDQDALDKAKNSKQGTAEQNAREVERLQKIVDKDKSTIAAHDEFDSQLKERGRGGKSDILGLTDRQRAGAQISGPAVALLDVNKQQLAVLHRIDKNTSGKTGRGNPYGD